MKLLIEQKDSLFLRPSASLMAMIVVSLLIMVLLASFLGCGLPSDPIYKLYSQDIYPGTANAYNVGSEDLPYLSGYFEAIHVSGDSLYIDGVKNPWELIEGSIIFPEEPLGYFLRDDGEWAEIAGGEGHTHDNLSILDLITSPFTVESKGKLDGIEANAVALGTVKADSDISDAIIRKHDHSNKAILDNTQESFTTALMDAYDWLVANVTSAWKATVDNHIDDTSNPHQVTANQVLPSQTGQVGKYLKTDGSNVSWDTPAGGGNGESEQTIVLSSDVANSSTTLANVTGITFNAEANSTYIIEAFLLWNTSATAVGIKVSATATNGPLIQAGHFITDAAAGTPDSSSWNANDVVTTTSASAFTTYNMGKVNAILKTNNASTWQLRFAAETTGTITVKAGSVLRYRKAV